MRMTDGVTQKAPLGWRSLSAGVNQLDHQLRLDPRVSLLDALREHLGLTGASCS